MDDVFPRERKISRRVSPRESGEMGGSLIEPRAISIVGKKEERAARRRKGNKAAGIPSLGTPPPNIILSVSI